MLVAPKRWELRGEVSSSSRPQNSLLEVDVEFDHATNPAPVITESDTRTLEEIIKQRIIEESWDDVIRKQPIDQGGFKPAVEHELEHTKSDKGLADIYEQSFMEASGKWKAPEKVKEQHKAIEVAFKHLCYKLDALTNFNFTPKPPSEQVETVTNVAALKVEEVAPVAQSDATSLMAPHEIYQKPKGGVLKEEAEFTKEERRARRRAKKRQKRSDQKLVDKVNPGLGNKYEKEKVLNKLKQARNLQVGQTATSSRGSSALFKQLQAETQSTISQMRGEKEANNKTSRGKKRKRAPKSISIKM
mmetsp:Transcript_1427/g.1985  ORF Transcript_1427/g.1985 Transcript_1427/m.1985 type:complete len:302 (-) Transcript_1427:48-953(-)